MRRATASGGFQRSCITTSRSSCAKRGDAKPAPGLSGIRADERIWTESTGRTLINGQPEWTRVLRGRQPLGHSLVRETSMTRIWLGVLLAFGGVLQMAYQPIWRGGFAPGDPVTPLNLKDRLAALGSNRIGLDLRWSRLAPRSCWPGLPSDFETNFVNGRALRGLSGRLSVLEPCLFLAHREILLLGKTQSQSERC
jgi:hypothetical protein